MLAPFGLGYGNVPQRLLFSRLAWERLVILTHFGNVPLMWLDARFLRWISWVFSQVTKYEQAFQFHKSIPLRKLASDVVRSDAPAFNHSINIRFKRVNPVLTSLWDDQRKTILEETLGFCCYSWIYPSSACSCDYSLSTHNCSSFSKLVHAGRVPMMLLTLKYLFHGICKGCNRYSRAAISHFR